MSHKRVSVRKLHDDDNVGMSRPRQPPRHDIIQDQIMSEENMNEFAAAADDDKRFTSTVPVSRSIAKDNVIAPNHHNHRQEQTERRFADSETSIRVGQIRTKVLADHEKNTDPAPTLPKIELDSRAHSPGLPGLHKAPKKTMKFGNTSPASTVANSSQTASSADYYHDDGQIFITTVPFGVHTAPGIIQKHNQGGAPPYSQSSDQIDEFAEVDKEVYSIPPNAVEYVDGNKPPLKREKTRCGLMWFLIAAVLILVILAISLPVFLLRRSETSSSPREQINRSDPQSISPALQPSVSSLPTSSPILIPTAASTTTSPSQRQSMPPSLIPISSPSPAPSTSNMGAPVPVSVPVPPSPGFPPCSFCGPGLQVTMPDALVHIEGVEPVSCAVLETAGRQGFIDPDTCPLFPLFAAPCGCQLISASASPTTSLSPTIFQASVPVGAPVPPSPGFPPCSFCGPGLQVTMPSVLLEILGQPPVSCGAFETVGRQGFVDPQVCPLLPAFAAPCGCEPVSTTASPTASSVSPIFPTPVPVGVSVPPSPGFPPCSVCGEGLQVTHPDVLIVLLEEEPPVGCGILEILGTEGFVDPLACPIIQALTGPCGCEPISS